MAKKYTVHPIDANTFAIEEKTVINQGLCYLLCGKEKALLIDTGLGYDGLKETVLGLTGLPVIVADTHAHVDHIGGNHLFGEIWFHEKDKEVFQRHIDPDYSLGLLASGMPGFVMPLLKLALGRTLRIDPSGNYRYFGDEFVFHLGERDVEVIPTPGHTPGSVCFLDRANRQLFSGDTVCEWGILLHFRGESCSAETFLSSIERLIALSDQYDTIWPGHHGFPVDKSYLEEYRACAQSILDGTAEYKKVNGQKSAVFQRVLISVQE